MASYYGVNNTKQYVNIPSEKIPAGEQYGRIHIAYDEYTTAATGGASTIETADTIAVMKLPAGARIIDATMVHEDFGGSGVLELGITGDVDYLLAAVAVNAAGAAQMDGEAGNLVKLSAETQCYVTCTNNTATVSKKFQVTVSYVID